MRGKENININGGLLAGLVSARCEYCVLCAVADCLSVFDSCSQYHLNALLRWNGTPRGYIINKRSPCDAEMADKYRTDRVRLVGVDL